MTHKKNAIGVVALIASIALLSGCSTASTPDSNDADSLPVPELTSIGTYTSDTPLPFDSYHLSTDELTRLQFEQAQYLQECAAQFSVTVEFAGDYLRPTGAKYLQWGGRLGTMPIEHASQWGYHASPDGPFSLGSGFYIKDVLNLQPDQSDPGGTVAAVLYGVESESTESSSPSLVNGTEVPKGGCFGALQDEVDTELLSLSNYTSELMNLTYNDSRVRKAMSEWSSCMKDAGYNIEHPEDAAAQAMGETVTAAEVAAATTDFTCTQSSNWSNIYYNVLAGYQEEAIGRHVSDLEAVLESEKAWLAALDRLT